MSGNDIVWDLTEIFASVDDPKISKTIDSLMAIASGLVSQYKGKINIPGFTAQNLQHLLEHYEDLLADMQELFYYSVNIFNANMTLPETKTLYNKVIAFRSSILTKLAFVEMEIGNLVTKNPQIINEKILSNYMHYLERNTRKTPFKLSEIEEELILEKDQNGVMAMEQLRASWISSRKFTANVEGKERMITRSEIIPLLQHPDRETRKSVFKGMYRMFEEEQEIYSSIVRNTCSNWVKNVKRRQYESYIHQSLIDNDISQEIIDKLMKTITKNIHIYQKFWRVKARVLNLPKLEGFDISAYIASDKRYSWNEIRKMSIQLFTSFDKSFGDIVTDLFERKHIDAGIRQGKTDFIYCNPWYNGKSAFILTGFTGLPSDIRSLSQEL
ncbi:MAG: M3 family metallopeptidase, partial [Promethearchaeota archaeon]